MAAVDWVQDMTAGWVRILSAAGGGGTALDEAVDQISSIGQASRKAGRFGRLRRNAADPAGAPAVTVLCRQLIAGVLVSDLLIGRLCLLAGQTREQVLEQLSGDLPVQLQDRQLRALLAEASQSCALLRDPERPSYAGLGTHIEDLLRLAEQQATDIVDAARAAAAEITASVGTQQPVPGHAGRPSGAREPAARRDAADSSQAGSG